MSTVPGQKTRFAAIRNHPRLTATVVIVLFSLIALGGGIALGTWRNICHDCPSIAQIHVWEPTQSTKIFSHDGILIEELGQERRTQVALQHLPPYVPQAFIAIEDRRFYEHRGWAFDGSTDTHRSGAQVVRYAKALGPSTGRVDPHNGAA